MSRLNKRIMYGAIIFVVGGFLLLQLLPYGRDRNAPPVIEEPNWDSPQTRALVERACFDCHSNVTHWPWYSYIAPMSWMVQQDVEEGRVALNFSEWNQAEWDEADLERLVEVVSKDQMPLPYYVILHPEADLTVAEKGQLINGLITSLEPADRESAGDSSN